MMQIRSAVLLAAGVAVLAIGAATPWHAHAQSATQKLDQDIRYEELRLQEEELRSSCQAEQRAVSQKYGQPADVVSHGNDVLVHMDRELLQKEREQLKERDRIIGGREADPVQNLRLCGIEVRDRQLQRRPGQLVEETRARWLDQIRKGCAAEYAALPTSWNPERTVAPFTRRLTKDFFLGELKRYARDPSVDGRLRACAARVRLSEWGPVPADLAAPLPPVRAGVPGAPPAGSAAAAPAAGATSGVVGAKINPIDSKTKPGSHERGLLCDGYISPRGLSKERENAAMAACIAQPILTIRDIQVVQPPEMKWGNGGECVKAIAVKTEPFNTRIMTTVQVRNNCKGVQHVHVVLKEPSSLTFSTGIWFPSKARTPWPNWPPYNELPKLGYVPTVGGQNWHIVNVGETIETTVTQSVDATFDIPHKIGACDAWSAEGKRRKSFQDHWFTRFDCFEIPPAEPSAQQREWERMMKDPTPIGPQPKKKAPPAPKPTPPKTAPKK